MKTATEGEAYEMYNEMLNDCYGEINVGVVFEPARVLEELDPIAYNCGFNDFCDSNEIEIED